jgi:AbrB family looped-hinge helix DNA binding protein
MKLEIIRHIDKLGRICIPMDFRKSFGIKEDTLIIVEETKEGVMLKVKCEKLHK